MSKAKIIGWVIASPFILIAGGIAFCEANKAYWDHQVKLMCEKDGGVTVYERVELTKDEYEIIKNSSGKISIPFGWEKNDSPYYIYSKTEVIFNDSPKVWKDEMLIIRRRDNNVIAKKISYSRRGGDMPTGILHPSHFSCGNDEINLKKLQSVITIKGE